MTTVDQAGRVATTLLGNVHTLRRDTYEAMVSAGLLDGEPVELLEGILVEMSPQGSAHHAAVMRLTRLLAPLLTQGYDLSIQSPLSAGASSQPEPDLAVIREGDYSRAHPDRAELVVEVTSSSHAIDLRVKPSVYAAAQVPEYWVVDLPRRQVVVHRTARSAGYETVVVAVSGEELTPVALPTITLAVSAMLEP